MKSLVDIIASRDLEALVDHEQSTEDVSEALVAWTMEDPSEKLLHFVKMWLRQQLMRGSAIHSSFQTDELTQHVIQILQTYYMTQPSYAQCASQILFYANFQSKQDYLCFNFPVECYQTPDLSLALSLTHNIHNILIVCPESNIMDTECPLVQSTSPWAGPFVRDILSSLFDYCIYNKDNPDLTAETATEVLRCFFAAKVAIKDNQLLRILHQDNDALSVAAISTISSSSDFSGYQVFFKEHKLLPKLVRLLDMTLRDEEFITSDILSITMVLYKLSADSELCETMRSHVFPPSVEYDEMIKQQQGTNIKPLDAPPGTLRYKLTQLLTHHDSNVKRIIGELLWILCGSDATEFVNRVGMGNGVAILRAKGLVNIS